ncbi:MAG TPA: hypothetical protein VFA68_00835 [Terriglobales bacterium]|nr:hypothetical protein [Terriglobales bacterium]
MFTHRERYGNWRDWLLCLAIAVLLGIRLPMRNPEGHSPEYWRKHPEKAREATATAKPTPVKEATKPDRFNEILNILAFAFTVASWGWSVIAPDSSVYFGSVLFLIATVFVVIAICRIWDISLVAKIAILMASLLGFGVFDWNIVIKPQRGKEFKDLLVEGYHISDECSQIPGKEDTPEWMREQSTRWQTRTESAIVNKLTYRDIQMWRGSGVIGLVADKNMNAYQCLSLANKIMVLENVIAEHFDPKLQHVDYKGPTYWLNVKDGKADITEALKAGAGSADIYINSDGSTKDGKVQVEGHMGKSTQPSSGPK